MREIVLDTETTGLDPAQGHKVVEIGCVELENRLPTGRTFWKYINPERDMPTEAFEIHGLSEAFLADKPLFADVADEFLDFIGDAGLVIHNAGFDMKFLNYELDACGREIVPFGRATDTVALARRKFPGSPVSLDALCKRFGIDNSTRTKHGALLDSELLAEVYLELMGGRQTGLDLASQGAGTAAKPSAKDASAPASKVRNFREPRPHTVSEAEAAAHAKFLEKLKDPIWSA